MLRTATMPTSLKDEPDQNPKHGREVSVEERPEPTGTGGSKLLCAACGNPVTTTSARTSVNGAHSHVFCNPGGYVFEIGCFSSAPGCGAIGPPSLEFTWFPGHSWEMGHCKSCAGQLGWKFSTSGDSFFGIILDKLTESGSDEK